VPALFNFGQFSFTKARSGTSLGTNNDTAHRCPKSRRLGEAVLFAIDGKPTCFFPPRGGL
jgi:hypothetical protein